MRTGWKGVHFRQCISQHCFFAASIGVWTLIDQAINLRNPSANITTFSTPFVPAIPGGSTNVISFLGHKDSYVLLENNGELAVSSFTWSAMIFPENSEGPLFNWYVNDPEVSYHGTLIWMHAQRIHFRVLSTAGLSASLDSSTPLSLNGWHHVAISYNGNTGDAVMKVDEAVQTMALLPSSAPATAGPVAMGYRYYYNYPNPVHTDGRSFQGKMSCMRLWNIVRDLNIMRMDTPLCPMAWLQLDTYAAAIHVLTGEIA